MARIEFQQLEIVAVPVRRGEVRVRVTARYRLIPDAGEAAEGDGMAELQWLKTRAGWRIARAVLRADENTPLPGGWK